MTPLAEALTRAGRTLEDYRASGLASGAGPHRIWPARLAGALETLASAAAWQSAHTCVREDGAAVIAPEDLAVVRAALRISARRRRRIGRAPDPGRCRDVLGNLGHPAGEERPT